MAVTVVATFYMPVVGAAALGNLAGQVTGNVLGVQKGFDFKSFATSVATAGITQGLLGPANAPTGIGSIIQKTLGTTLGGYGVIAARAVVGNVVSQGVGNITGSQKEFSWSSVAIAGIADIIT